MINSIIKNQIISAVANAYPDARFISVNLIANDMSIYRADDRCENKSAGEISAQRWDAFKMFLNLEVIKFVHIDITGSNILVQGVDKHGETKKVKL